MGLNREQVASFLFDIGGKFPGKQHFSVVEDAHYTGIPSNLPNLYLLIQKPEEVVRILARIDHTKLTCDNPDLIWLSAQSYYTENDKYGKHLPVHGLYSIHHPNKVIDKLTQ